MEKESLKGIEETPNLSIFSPIPSSRHSGTLPKSHVKAKPPPKAPLTQQNQVARPNLAQMSNDPSTATAVPEDKGRRKDPLRAKSPSRSSLVRPSREKVKKKEANTSESKSAKKRFKNLPKSEDAKRSEIVAGSQTGLTQTFVSLLGRFMSSPGVCKHCSRQHHDPVVAHTYINPANLRPYREIEALEQRRRLRRETKVDSFFRPEYPEEKHDRAVDSIPPGSADDKKTRSWAI